MGRPRHTLPRVAVSAGVRGIAALALLGACSSDRALPAGDQGELDMASPLGPEDLAFEWFEDAGPPEPCSADDPDPTCHRAHYGPPRMMFQLQSDHGPDEELETDKGVGRNLNGFLVLDSTHTVLSYLFVPNAGDPNGAGSVSKINSKTIREEARYLTFTCLSLQTGSSAPCDGMNGCCSLDDAARYAARLAHQPYPGHQAVQRTSNSPSRTAVDYYTAISTSPTALPAVSRR